MATVGEIERFLDAKIPFATAEEWDNTGLLTGDESAEVSCILLALDISEAVVKEAYEKGCGLIISHHPLIFDPLKKVTAENRALFSLIRKGISAICVHTPLDKAAGGVADRLAALCGLFDTALFAAGDGRIGELERPLPVPEYAKRIKAALKSPAVLFFDSGRAVRRVAAAGGSGGFLLPEATAEGADTLVTGEAKHSYFIEAQDRGINLICAGHYHTELCGLDRIEQLLKSRFPGIELLRAEALNNIYGAV